MSDRASTPNPLPTDASSPRPAPADAASRANVGLGLAVRRARAGRYTLAELAERADLSVGLLSLIERGRGNPSFTTLARIADALGLGLVELVAAAMAMPREPWPQDQTPATSGAADAPASLVTAVAATQPVEVIAPDAPHSPAGHRPVADAGGDDGWMSSMTLRGGQEATVLVQAGALELTLRDRTATHGQPGDVQPLSVDLSVRTLGGEAPLSLPDVDDPRWLDVVRGATPFRPASLAGQLLFTHVLRCTRVDPSTATLQHWIGELRGYLVTEPLPPAELARIFGG